MMSGMRLGIGLETGNMNKELGMGLRDIGIGLEDWNAIKMSEMRLRIGLGTRNRIRRVRMMLTGVWVTNARFLCQVLQRQASKGGH